MSYFNILDLNMNERVSVKGHIKVVPSTRCPHVVSAGSVPRIR